MAVIAFTRSLPVIFILSLLLARVISYGTKGRRDISGEDSRENKATHPGSTIENVSDEDGEDSQENKATHSGSDTDGEDSRENTAAHSGSTIKKVSSCEQECRHYIVITSFALLNTFLVLVVLLYTLWNIYSLDKRKERTTGKTVLGVKDKMKKVIDDISGSRCCFNVQMTKTENECQVQTEPSPNLELKTSLNKRQPSPRPPLPTTGPPPCSRSEDSELNPNPRLRVASGTRDIVLPPRPQSICPIQTHPEKLGSHITTRPVVSGYDYIELPLKFTANKQHQGNTEKEEKNEKKDENKKPVVSGYDYIELPLKFTANKQHQGYTEEEEKNEKKDENKKQSANDSEEEEHEYDYIDMPVIPTPQKQITDKETQTDKKDEKHKKLELKRSLSVY